MVDVIHGALMAAEPLVSIPPEPLWESTVGFIAVFLGLVFAIGAMGRNLSIGTAGAYVMFVHFSVNLDVTMLTQVMYISLAATTLAIGFKFWKIEGPGGDI